MTNPVRRIADGGYLCESGTGGGRRNTPCQRRAEWIMAQYDPAKPPPGSVVCDEHRNNPAARCVWKPLAKAGEVKP